MKIVVVSLLRSLDRREQIEANLARLGVNFEFFNAIDASRGEHIGISRFDEAAALRDLHRPLSPGEIGCFASHYLLWQNCVKVRTPFVIIEDDAEVSEGFTRALKVARELLPNCPLIRLGLTAEAANSQTLVSLPQGFEFVSLGRGTFGTQCYMVSPRGAEMLMEHAEVWSLPVDMYLDRSYMHGLRSFGLRPYFVKHADPSLYPSVIGDERYRLWPPDPMIKVRAMLEGFLAKRGRKLKPA